MCIPVFTGLKKLPSIFASNMYRTFYYQRGTALQHSVSKINTTKPGSICNVAKTSDLFTVEFQD